MKADKPNDQQPDTPSPTPERAKVMRHDTAREAENPVADRNDLLKPLAATNAQGTATNVIKPAKFGVLEKWGTTRRPPPIEWVVHHMFQARAANSLAGEPGVGKSWLACDLAVSVATGTPFLERDTQQGPVLILNFDDGETLPRLYAERTAHARGYAFDELPIYYPPEEDMEIFDAGMLDPAVLGYLAYQIEELKPRLILVDSFASAFPGVGGNGAKQVVKVHRALRQLRLKSFNAALVILDHTPKNGKGPSGSVQKNARVRTGHIVSRLEYFGKDMLLWEFDKFNAAPPQPSFAIEREQDETSARLIVHELPGQLNGYKARRALETALKIIYDAGDEGVTRTALTEQVMTLTHVSKRTFDGVIVDELREHPKVLELQLPGRGNPKGYRWHDPPEGGGERNAETLEVTRPGPPAQMEAAPDQPPEVVVETVYGFGLYFSCPRCDTDKKVSARRRAANFEPRSVTWRAGTDDYVFEAAPFCKKHRRRYAVVGDPISGVLYGETPLDEEVAVVMEAAKQHYAKL